jgi:hypothetical protein
MDAKIARVQSAASMSRFACLFACMAIIAGCQRRAADAPPPASGSYRTDIENLCDVLARSGADKLGANERALVIANWLAARVQTQEAHEYLIKIQPLNGAAKADALDAEATRVGLPGCALAAEWRGSAAR